MGKVPFRVYQSWLPNEYSGTLDEERDHLVKQINEELRRSLYSEPRINQCTILLSRFYVFRYEYTEEEQMYIIKSLLVLIFHKEDVNYNDQTLMAKELSKILLRRPHLPDLIIEWR